MRRKEQRRVGWLSGRCVLWKGLCGRGSVEGALCYYYCIIIHLVLMLSSLTPWFSSLMSSDSLPCPALLFSCSLQIKMMMLPSQQSAGSFFPCFRPKCDRQISVDLHDLREECIEYPEGLSNN